MLMATAGFQRYHLVVFFFLFLIFFYLCINVPNNGLQVCRNGDRVSATYWLAYLLVIYDSQAEPKKTKKSGYEGGNEIALELSEISGTLWTRGNE